MCTTDAQHGVKLIQNLHKDFNHQQTAVAVHPIFAGFHH